MPESQTFDEALIPRPVIFYSNDFDSYLWDDLFYPKREVQGFYSKDELQRLVIQKLKTNKPITKAEIQALEVIKLIDQVNGNALAVSRAG